MLERERKSQASESEDQKPLSRAVLMGSNSLEHFLALTFYQLKAHTQPGSKAVCLAPWMWTPGEPIIGTRENIEIHSFHGQRVRVKNLNLLFPWIFSLTVYYYKDEVPTKSRLRIWELKQTIEICLWLVKSTADWEKPTRSLVVIWTFRLCLTKSMIHFNHTLYFSYVSQDSCKNRSN